MSAIYSHCSFRLLVRIRTTHHQALFMRLPPPPGDWLTDCCWHPVGPECGAGHHMLRGHRPQQAAGQDSRGSAQTQPADHRPSMPRSAPHLWVGQRPPHSWWDDAASPQVVPDMKEIAKFGCSQMCLSWGFVREKAKFGCSQGVFCLEVVSVCDLPGFSKFRFSVALRPQRPYGLRHGGAQDGYLHFHIAPELWRFLKESDLLWGGAVSMDPLYSGTPL